jgi:sulfur relay protein TusB/DsrH
MLHVVSQSPFSHSALTSCFTLMQDSDHLLLVQDAVIATTVLSWILQLQHRNVYVLQDDLIARGLVSQCGILVDMCGYVALVETLDSPLCW